MPKTILVVDDEMLIALDIQSQLEDLGHRVLIASTVGEAVVMIERENIAVAIVDWHLRDKIGAPITDLLTQRQVPFVVCSGSALRELADLFPTSPILSKPFASNDLIAALNRVIDGGLVD